MDKIYALNEIQVIVNPILQQYGVSRAYLFGSYARGEATGQSDIDMKQLMISNKVRWKDLAVCKGGLVCFVRTGLFHIHC